MVDLQRPANHWPAGAAVIRSQTMADVNAAQGAVAGKSWKKTASATGKKTG